MMWRAVGCVFLVGCGPSAAEAWSGFFSVESYQTALAPTETTTDPTSTTARMAGTSALGCEDTPADDDWGSEGFGISTARMESGWYLDVARCTQDGTCDAISWAGGGSTDLGESGGTAGLVASSFLASTSGGGVCELRWWKLDLSGTVDAPALKLMTEFYGVGLEDGDALDCEAMLDDDLPRDCTGIQLLSGARW